MKQLLLVLILVGGAVSARADAIPIAPANVDRSGDLDEATNWPTGAMWQGLQLHERLLHSGLKFADRNGDDEFRFVPLNGNTSIPGTFFAGDGAKNGDDMKPSLTATNHNPVAVPEPATILLLGTGLCSVIGAARGKYQH